MKFFLLIPASLCIIAGYAAIKDTGIRKPITQRDRIFTSLFGKKILGKMERFFFGPLLILIGIFLGIKAFWKF